LGASDWLLLGEDRKETVEKKRMKEREAFQKYHKQGELKKCIHQTDLMEICQI